MKKSIVFVITKSEVGGAQTWICELKQVLDADYNIYLITSKKGWLTDEFSHANVKIIPSLADIKNPISILKIASALKKFKADVVISSSANAGVYSRLAKLFYKHKHIYVSHGWSCIYNGGRLKKVFCFIEKKLAMLTDKVLCISNDDKDKALNIIGIDFNKVIVIRNGIIPGKSKIKINDRKKILFVGRMISPKLPELFISLADYFPDLSFYLVGTGPKKKNMVKECINKKNVCFLGEVKKFDAYHDYDIFVLCSSSEGLPMSALGAASAGVPLLLSDVGGCKEMIIANNAGEYNGLLFSNNIDSLRKELEKLVNTYNKYYKVAQSLKHVFNVYNSKDKYIELIEN